MERMILGLSGKGSVYIEDASVFFTHRKQYVLWGKNAIEHVWILKYNNNRLQRI